MPTLRLRLAVSALLLAGIVWVFLPLRHHAFVTLDDGIYIAWNKTVQQGLTPESARWAFGMHVGYWQPLTWLSHMLDVQLFGLDAGRHHLVNLGLHAASALVLLWVLSSATRQFWPSLVVAAFFAVHPLRVESVAWAAERKDVLSTFLWMLTLAAYARYTRRPAVLRMVLVAAAFLAGLMAKPMLVTVPVTLLLFDLWPLSRRPGTWTHRRLLMEKLPLAALAVVVAAITWYGQHRLHTVLSFTPPPWPVRWGNAAVVCAAYPLKLLWPTNLSVIYPYPYGLDVPRAVAALGVLAGISLCVWRWRAHRFLVVGWLWYLVTVAPTLGIIPFGATTMADRFTYVPAIGLLLMAAWSLRAWAEARPKWAGLLTAAVLLAGAASATATRRQLGHWRDSVTLYEQALRVTAGNWQAHNNLGVVLQGQGRMDEAREHYLRAIGISPYYADAHNNLGTVFYAEGRKEEAESCYRAAVGFRPGHPDAHQNLAIVLYEQEKHRESLEHFRKASALAPESEQVRYGLGTALLATGDRAGAREEYGRLRRAGSPLAEDLYLRLYPEERSP